jgi:hypothetical protein
MPRLVLLIPGNRRVRLIIFLLVDVHRMPANQILKALLEEYKGASDSPSALNGESNPNQSQGYSNNVGKQKTALADRPAWTSQH